MATRIGISKSSWLVALCVSVCGFSGAAFGQLREASFAPVQPTGYARHTCGADRLYCDHCVGKGGGPSASPSDSPSNGQFVAPQASGTVKGGASSVGVEGMALHFPALTLKMPSLHLPNLFRLRKGPSMLMDPSNAPYVEKPAGSQVLGAIPALSIPNGGPSNDPSNGLPKGPSSDLSPLQKPLQRSGQKSASTSIGNEHTIALQQLRQREFEIERMGRQIDRLEQAMSRLVEAQQPKPAEFRQASLMTPVAMSDVERVQPAVLVTPYAAKPLTNSMATRPRLERFPPTTIR